VVVYRKIQEMELQLLVGWALERRKKTGDDDDFEGHLLW